MEQCIIPKPNAPFCWTRECIGGFGVEATDVGRANVGCDDELEWGDCQPFICESLSFLIDVEGKLGPGRFMEIPELPQINILVRIRSFTRLVD
jgi:hypothetical protein